MIRLLLTGLGVLITAVTPASVPPNREQKLPPSEMVARTADALSQMRHTLSDALAKLEEARNSKDVVKLNCVNEKLTQVKGLLRISEQADIALQEALAKKEEMAAEHEFTKVTIASEKVRVLRTETEECIGQLAFRADQNVSVEVEVPNNLPSADPTHPPVFTPPPTRAPPASPTL